MMRDQDARRTGLLTVLLVVAAVVLAGWLLAWLRAAAPVVDTSAAAVPAAVPDPALVPDCDGLEDGTVEAAGAPVTSGLVLACPRLLDGAEVVYAGEVVGDVLARDGGSWVLLNDDAYALEAGPLGASGRPSGTNSGLTVWLPDPLDELATTPGRRDQRGDVLRVVATVTREDPADGGGLTLRAAEVELLSPAIAFDVPPHRTQAVVAAVLGLLALVVVVAERRTG